MDTKKCTFCNENISAALRRCPYCGSLLPAEPVNVEDGNAGSVDPDILLPDMGGFSSDEGDDYVQMAIDRDDDGGLVIKEFEDTGSEASAGEKAQVAEADGQQGDNDDEDSGSPVPEDTRNRMSNGLKVFLTVVSVIIPGIGQLIGLIISVLLMNSEDEDRKSFGLALMVACLVFFFLYCLVYFVLLLAVTGPKM